MVSENGLISDWKLSFVVLTFERWVHLLPDNDLYYPQDRQHSPDITVAKVFFQWQTAQNLFVLPSQQDAQEFLRFLLDKLHVEINRRPYVRRVVKEPEQKYARFR